ncbi:hypothetical protein ACFY3N_18855 [Streptomyces sp. NPDC000348]|uniref:hypothetical protein n=1 Tax=Streptomyces sp. NPDC000348 TaxID=3364538 RepID=UPI00368D44B0
MGVGRAGRRNARSHALGLQRPVPSDAEPVAVLDVHDGAVEHGPADAGAHAVARADVPAPSADPAEPAADGPADASGAETDRRAATAGTADDSRAGPAGTGTHDPAGAPPDLDRRVGPAHPEGGTGNAGTTGAARDTPPLTGRPDARPLATVRDPHLLATVRAPCTLATVRHAQTLTTVRDTQTLTTVRHAQTLTTVRHAQTLTTVRHAPPSVEARHTRPTAEVRSAGALGIIRPPGADTDTDDAAGALEARTDAVRQDTRADADGRWRRAEGHHVVHLPDRDGRRPPHGERRRAR